MQQRIKEITIGMSVITIFFIFSFGRGYVIGFLNRLELPLILISIISIALSILVVLIIARLFKNKLLKDWQDLKKNHRHYFRTYLPYWLIALALMMLSNLILYFFVSSDLAENEQAVREMFRSTPFFIYFSAVLIAPVLEELVFRGGFYYIFKNKYLFIFLSGISFGLIHIIGATSIDQLYYIIPYTIPGLAFAYALYKSKNFYVPIGLHFIHNGLVMALQIFVIFFGGDLLL